MDADSLLTRQAELVLADDPGLPGYAPRVWVYRNVIKALNWYGSVREKLDDAKFSSWFAKFKGFNDSSYPGGLGRAQNSSYHVPTCDWYNNGTAPRCSGFYHDQEQTPEHAGGGKAYMPFGPGRLVTDGDCGGQCDCGPTNPCAEYIFMHGAPGFRDWYINEYMLGEQTLRHKDPATGEPQPIGLGWLDDGIDMTGPSEEDPHYWNDTGASVQSMQAQVDAFNANMRALNTAVINRGGFYWQLMAIGGSGLELPRTTNASMCKANLRARCVPDPPSHRWFKMYGLPSTGVNESTFTDYTIEFLLTRGPYAGIGYSWSGCTSAAAPMAKEWLEDFGEPVGGAPCAETGRGSGVFEREWTKARVRWDCNSGRGSLTRKP